VILQFVLSSQMGKPFQREWFDWYVMLRNLGSTKVAAQRGQPSRSGWCGWCGWCVKIWTLVFSDVEMNIKLIPPSDDDNVEELDHNLAHPAVYSRLVMSFISNFVIPCILTATLPLSLIGTDSGLNFVQNCVSVAFIPMIDDVDPDDSANMQVLVRREMLPMEVPSQASSPSTPLLDEAIFVDAVEPTYEHCVDRVERLEGLFDELQRKVKLLSNQ